MIRVQSWLWQGRPYGLWSEYTLNYDQSIVLIMIRVQSGLGPEYSPDYGRGGHPEYSRSTSRIMVEVHFGLWSEYSTFMVRVQSRLWFHISQYTTCIPIETAALDCDRNIYCIWRLGNYSHIFDLRKNFGNTMAGWWTMITTVSQ